MRVLERVIFGSGEKINQRTYIFNLCSSMIYSIQSALLLLIVTRIGGLYEAGIFSIIYTVTQTLASMGSYSMRNFQVSDVKNEYSFVTYYTSRWVTCVCMTLCCLVYGVCSGFSFKYMTVTVLFAIYRFVDGIEDVYHGAVQKDGRLDAVSIAMSIRITISIISFLIVYWLTKQLAAATLSLALMSVFVYLICQKTIKQRYNQLKSEISFGRVFRLLWVCFPIFLGAILYNYLVNAPKYSIARNLTEETQTIFNIIFMPIFVINILSTFIFKPVIVNMGKWWNEKDMKQFVLSTVRQFFTILFLTSIVCVAGYFFGCPVLTLIYGVDLSAYRNLFVLLLVFGGIAALSTFLSVVLTIMRKQIYIIVGYVLGFFVNLFLTDHIVLKYDIDGAGYSYGIIMGTVLISFALSVIWGILRAGKGQNKNEGEKMEYE